MQLARLTLPPDDAADGAIAQLRRKFAQIAVAERIAIASSKASILEAYVNRVPMGGNVYGVEAAARTYFGEPASDLDLAQASLLAAIPNDPSRLAPERGLDRVARASALRPEPHGRARRDRPGAGRRSLRREPAREAARRRHRRRSARALLPLAPARGAKGPRAHDDRREAAAVRAGADAGRRRRAARLSRDRRRGARRRQPHG